MFSSHNSYFLACQRPVSDHFFLKKTPTQDNLKQSRPRLKKWFRAIPPILLKSWGYQLGFTTGGPVKHGRVFGTLLR